MLPLSGAEARALRARAQKLKAGVKFGKAGITPEFLAGLNRELTLHELVKVRFEDFKEQKKELAPQLAEKTGSHLVTRVGNVVVLYRPRPVEQTDGEEQ